MKQGIVAIVLSLVMPTSMAATNPASTNYVDKKFAGIQQQIDAINKNPIIAHPIGSCYGGGVVFYVNPDANAVPGMKGLIIAPIDAATDVSWETGTPGGGTAVNGTLPGYFTGFANTGYIEGTNNGTLLNPTYLWPAADAATAYNSPSHNAPCPGETCTEWYLPSQYELNQFYLTSFNSLATFGFSCTDYIPITGNAYWTSTASSTSGTTSSWVVDFDNGNVYSTPSIVAPPSPFNVRAVRAF